MASVTDSQGTQLLRNGVNIPNVKSIGAIGLGRTLRDTTSLGDLIHKFKLNIPDIPEISVEIWWDGQEATHNLMALDEVNGNTTNTYQINIEQGDSPAENIDLGVCWVLGHEWGPFEVDGDVVMKFNLKPTQFPTGLFD
jgi:hypothetical protein